MSASATIERAMDTLFDPDAVTGRSLLGAAHAAPEERARTAVGRTLSDAADSAQARLGAVGGGPMLDDVVAGVWEGLAAHRVVECPGCGSEMRPEYGVHALPIGGRCGGCGSTLT